MHRRGIEVDAAAGYMWRRSGRLPFAHVNSLQCDGLLWVWCNGDWRNKSAIEPRRSLRPDAVMHSSASGECVLLSPRVKATVRVPSPSVDGLRPRLRRGRLVALRPQCLVPQLSGFPCVVWFQARPTLSCQRQGHLRQRRCQIVQSSSAAPATWL